MQYTFQLPNGLFVTSSRAILEIEGAVLIGRRVDAADVRAECERRMMALLGARDRRHLDLLLANGTREATRLLNKAARRGEPLTEDELARADQLEQRDAAIEMLRAASNALEANPPADYADDRHWSAP